MCIFVPMWEIRPGEKFLPFICEVKQVGESQPDLQSMAAETEQQALQVTGPSQQA